MVSLVPKSNTALGRPVQVSPCACSNITAHVKTGDDEILHAAPKPALGLDYLDEKAEAETLNRALLHICRTFPVRYPTSNTCVSGPAGESPRQSRTTSKAPRAITRKHVEKGGTQHEKSKS